jgi:pimeloyl-ACP methyl ester carboxylesterase
MKKYLLSTAALICLLAAGATASASRTASSSEFEWKPCPKQPGLQCGSLRVPVDWSKPDGAKITIRFNRRPAEQPEQKLGSLFFHAGGPGDGAIWYVEHPDGIFTPAERARFDLIGIDPRGYGASTPIRCGVSTIVPGYTFFPRTAAQFRRMVQHNRAVGESCLKETGPLLGHVDSVSVARDMEAVRAALGISKIDFLGVSYGSLVGAIYAQLFPGHVRSMVLDGALDHQSDLPLLSAVDIAGVEDAFDRFARWCRTAPSCALHGRDVGRLFDELVARADRDPIPVKGAVHPVTGEDIRMNVERGLYFKEPNIYGPDVSWAGLSRGLEKALAGDASYFAMPKSESHTGSEYTTLGIVCADYGTDIESWPEMQRRMQLGRQLAPHLHGASESWYALRCTGWPLKPSNPPRRLDVRGAPPILIVNATHDPSTHYVWAHNLAGQIRGSVLLTRIGDGHTSLYSSHCARQTIDRYLIGGVTPSADAVCH